MAAYLNYPSTTAREHERAQLLLLRKTTQSDETRCLAPSAKGNVAILTVPGDSAAAKELSESETIRAKAVYVAAPPEVPGQNILRLFTNGEALQGSKMH